MPAVDPSTRERLAVWEEFARTKRHILERGDEEWSANKILLQLACEHADESPVTEGAEAWLNKDNCDWLWLRKIRRSEEYKPDPCIRVFEGHTNSVSGATVLPDGGILSWSNDGTLRIWDAQSGACSTTLEGHTNSVSGATVLPDGRILSWAGDATLRIWDAESGVCLGSWKTKNAAFEVPDLWRFYQQATNADTLTQEAGIGPLERGISCIFPELKKRILWQGEGEWKAHHLWSEGKIVVSCHKQLEFLPLYSGRKRVTLAEAHEILQNTQNN